MTTQFPAHVVGVIMTDKTESVHDTFPISYTEHVYRYCLTAQFPALVAVIFMTKKDSSIVTITQYPIHMHVLPLILVINKTVINKTGGVLTHHVLMLSLVLA